jgi:hyperosmotically inducible periplasmic protein
MSSRWLFGICASMMFVAACSQSDAGITTSVKSRLIGDDTVKAYQINVDTQNHVVTLTGEVRTPQEQARAVQLARETKGVNDVVNNMTVGTATPTSGYETEPSATERAKEATSDAYDKTKQGAENLGDKTKETLSKTGEVITDAWITTKVKSQFVGEDALKGSDINVDTNDHVVTLRGTVMSSAGRAKAMEIARTTEGVRDVVDRLMMSAKR